MEDQEAELGNIPPSYAVPTTPHTRIHKDHPINHVIGDVKSSVQTRRMTTSYSELGFLSAIYEGKTHQDLHTCLFACFLSQEEPKRVSKALSDPAICVGGVVRMGIQMDVKSAFLYGQIEEEGCHLVLDVGIKLLRLGTSNSFTLTMYYSGTTGACMVRKYQYTTIDCRVSHDELAHSEHKNEK
ncbi:hypothetical protein Tco_1283683 [Tanacetum coccineum]